jgi:hypothetical protein
MPAIRADGDFDYEQFVRCVAELPVQARCVLQRTVHQFVGLGDADALRALLCTVAGYRDHPPATASMLRHQLAAARVDSRLVLAYARRCGGMSPRELTRQYRRVVQLLMAARGAELGAFLEDAAGTPPPGPPVSTPERKRLFQDPAEV